MGPDLTGGRAPGHPLEPPMIPIIQCAIIYTLPPSSVVVYSVNGSIMRHAEWRVHSVTQSWYPFCTNHIISSSNTTCCVTC